MKPEALDAPGRPLSYLAAVAVAALAVSGPAGCSRPPETGDKLTPIRAVVDLDIGERAQVELADGRKVQVELVEVACETDRFRQAVRTARVRVRVEGSEAVLESANYNLPRQVAGVRIDCPAVGALYDASDSDRWGLEKDARLRLWPARGPLVADGTFLYPVRQRILANDTQMSNEVCYVDGGEIPGENRIYYHSGLDFGASEGLVEVISATDGLVVSVGDSVLAGHREDTPVMPRYDVVYLLDRRGWYYRYSHLKEIDPALAPGLRIGIGSRIGLTGKEGGSGGWSHLHFEISARQPSGKWGTEEAYAYTWQAYCDRYDPALVAVARPHRLAAAGDTVTLDGSKSWQRDGEKLDYQWSFTDGSAASGPLTRRVYPEAGTYYEALKVTDRAGNVDYDFTAVQVIDPEHPDHLPPSVHVNYHPSLALRAGQEITFKVRTFNARPGDEVWDFGDGSPRETTRSVPCFSVETGPGSQDYRDQHHPQGYASLYHSYSRPGHYIVRVERTGEWGLAAVARVHVEVGP